MNRSSRRPPRLALPDAHASPTYRLLYQHLQAARAEAGKASLPAMVAALSDLEREIQQVRERLGIEPPCRYLLYDFEAGQLIGGLYSDYDEAAADAARLDNVRILSIPWSE